MAAVAGTWSPVRPEAEMGLEREARVRQVLWTLSSQACRQEHMDLLRSLLGQFHVHILFPTSMKLFTVTMVHNEQMAGEHDRHALSERMKK